MKVYGRKYTNENLRKNYGRRVIKSRQKINCSQIAADTKDNPKSVYKRIFTKEKAIASTQQDSHRKIYKRC